MKVICLSSGGIDSSVILHMLKCEKHEIFPLYVDYGHKSALMEIQSLNNICAKLELKPKIIQLSKLSFIKSGLTDSNISHIKDPYFPNRNLLLLTIAASYGYQKLVDVISIGLLDNVIFPDQTQKFVQDSEKLLSLSMGKAIKILAPLMELDKKEVIGLAKKHNIPLELTYSCYSGNMESCGKCKACIERNLALAEPVL